MNSAKSACPACHKLFTHTGLYQHLSKTYRSECRAVYAALQPQLVLGSSPYEQMLLMSTANSTLAGYPDRTFGSERPSGHDGTSYDLPASSPFDVIMGNTDDRKLPFH